MTSFGESALSAPSPISHEKTPRNLWTSRRRFRCERISKHFLCRKPTKPWSDCVAAAFKGRLCFGQAEFWSSTMIRQCAACGQKNRIPAEHLADEGRCGSCKAPLPPVKEPIDADDAS